MKHVKSMFSRGNISEKIRFSKFSVSNEIIIDMFVGIGYWVLQLSKKKPPAKIYCIDINPNAIEVRALRSYRNETSPMLIYRSVIRGPDQTSWSQDRLVQVLRTLILALIHFNSLHESIKMQCYIEQKRWKYFPVYWKWLPESEHTGKSKSYISWFDSLLLFYIQESTRTNWPKVSCTCSYTS